MNPFGGLAVQPGLPPMEATLVEELPKGDDWRFEPKWDGFRCLAFRDGDAVALQSKSGRPLARYFPEVADAILTGRAKRMAVDGELIIKVGGGLSFEALQMRLHPAESRIRRLASETPARLMLFDCLVDGKGRSMVEAPLYRRRAMLEAVHARAAVPALLLSPYTDDRVKARAWLERSGSALDGVIAKSRSAPYQPGERAMLKVKQIRTADCVVGGFRYGREGREVGSLLLGLYDDEGRLNHVGFTSAILAREKPALTRQLERLIEPPGFTGTAPGGPSRWSAGRSSEWQPLRPELVAEVRYDQVTGHRFRHGTRFLRWRPDKAPGQCRMDQLRREAPPTVLAEALS